MSSRTSPKKKTVKRTVRQRDDLQMASLEDLFVAEIKDLYSAEQQILEALPAMIRGASSHELQQALGEHLNVSREHVKRLNKVFEEIGKPAGSTKCKAIEGMIEENENLLRGRVEEAVKDAGILAGAQKVEHYEMAGYGTVRTYARVLGHNRAESLLKKTLQEEKQADKRLTQIADSAVNTRAVRNGRVKGTSSLKYVNVPCRDAPRPGLQSSEGR
jgi:ferritin-like metal-binding protein YciE